MRNDELTPFIPPFIKSNVGRAMTPTTPRLAHLWLRVAEQVLRVKPVPRLLTRLIVDRKLASIDFAAEGNPPPFYMPMPYKRS
jgi:hypothetical protein